MHGRWWGSLILMLGAVTAQDAALPADLSQALTPQLNVRFIERGFVAAARRGGAGTPARLSTAPVGGRRATRVAGKKEQPFLLPGGRSVTLAQFQGAAVLSSDRAGQALASPDRAFVVRPLKGTFDFSIGAVDPAFWTKLDAVRGGIAATGFSSDVVPGASHVMTLRNMTKASRLEVTIDKTKLSSLDHDDFAPTNIVITGDTPGLEVARVASTATSNTYSVTATADQAASSIEFSPTTDIQRAARTTDVPIRYPDQAYPGDTNRANIKLSASTADYRNIYSPFKPNTPLDFRWSPFLQASFPAVGLRPLTLLGKTFQAFTFGNRAVIDPAQLAWGDRLGRLASRLKEPDSVWKQELTARFCHALTTAGQRVRVAGLEGPASIDAAGANIDLFGSTGECYFQGLYHEGTDFMVPSGTSISSMMSGRVHTSGYWAKAGGHVGIIVGEFTPKQTALSGPFYLEIQYLHLNHCKFAFKPNQPVQAGEVLGVTAARGNSSCTTTYSPHLHVDTAVVYYDKNVMHKYYFDSLLFLSQANAFGTQIDKLLMSAPDGGNPDDATLPTPVFKKWAFSGCTSAAGTTQALVPNKPQRCQLVVQTTPNGLGLAGAAFTYSLSYVRQGQPGTTAVLPGTDTWKPGGGNVTYRQNQGTYTLGLPLQVRQDAARGYTTINVFGVLTFSNGKSKRIYEELPIGP